MCLCVLNVCVWVCVGNLKICPEITPGPQRCLCRSVKAEQEASEVVDFLLLIAQRSLSSANMTTLMEEVEGEISGQVLRESESECVCVCVCVRHLYF